LFHELFVPLEGEFGSGVEVGGEVEELGDGVPAWREKEVLEAVGEG
jgi:hypothetical protein